MWNVPAARYQDSESFVLSSRPKIEDERLSIHRANAAVEGFGYQRLINAQ
jgi:hypothetical protein